ncbi:MAG: RNA pseudouridine synthase [Treponema sp.]|nr:RNA pseudouridine synthase [Treponema sp.]
MMSNDNIEKTDIAHCSLLTAHCPSAHSPFVLDETENFAVVFKPPRMHSAPLRNGGGDTLLEWYAKLFPPVMNISGRKEGEGGLLHRLDYETQGLVLFAKNQNSHDFLLKLQEQGDFVKEYSAICQKAASPQPSFPPPPELSMKESFAIESSFRPFGPGRKQVRPVTAAPNKDSIGLYRTEVAGIDSLDDGHCAFTVKLKKGFRHQIRCHLAWIGWPVQNDPVYGEAAADGHLALRSHALSFTDPNSGELREYMVERMVGSTTPPLRG